MGILGVVWVLAGCAGGGGDGDTGGGGKPKCVPPKPSSGISLATNVQPIFNKGCVFAGCHLGPVAANGLDLSAGNSRKDTVNVPAQQLPSATLVVPGKPDQSYLLAKIEGTPGIAGDLMPLGCPGTPQGGAQCLTADEILAVRTWIAECAPNN